MGWSCVLGLVVDILALYTEEVREIEWDLKVEQKEKGVDVGGMGMGFG